jgi:hypothetical protein
MPERPVEPTEGREVNSNTTPTYADVERVTVEAAASMDAILDVVKRLQAERDVFKAHLREALHALTEGDQYDKTLAIQNLRRALK